MKKLVQIVCLVLAFEGMAIAQKEKCSRITHFGSAEICLPTMEGYKESYSDSIVKHIADATEVPANTILGYYLNHATHKRILSTGIDNYEDYFKVYGTKQVQDYKADKAILQQMNAMLSGNFITKNWDEFEEEMEGKGLGVEIGVPVVIKTYNLNDASFTYVMLVKYMLKDGNAFTMAMTLNGLLMNERLVWMAYYLDYKGEASINRLQQQSNLIIKQLLEANK